MKKIRPTKTVPKATSTKEYASIVSVIKLRIKESQIKAALSVNKELLELYWYIGQIVTEQQRAGYWGPAAVEQLANDLQQSFPGIAGFSRTNVFRMKAFFETYAKIPQLVGNMQTAPIFTIPWGHNVVLMEKVKKNDERLWYAQKALDNGWSRSTLEASIKSGLYKREGKAITNFQRTLPVPQSSIAQQTLKDPYLFDFLALTGEYNERDIEQGLIDNVQKMLLELGKGFAFIGRQYHLEIGNTDFYIDLLFYHYKLRCFIVVELKARDFDPRDAGELNFYLSAVDDLLRHPDDNPTIGLLLCKTKNNIIAEYALRDINKPMGVAGYETEIVTRLPKRFKSTLPTVAELEAEFEKYATANKPRRTRTAKK